MTADLSAPPVTEVEWRVSPRKGREDGKIVRARTAWLAYEAAGLIDKHGARLHFSEVECVQVGGER